MACKKKLGLFVLPAPVQSHQRIDQAVSGQGDCRHFPINRGNFPDAGGCGDAVGDACFGEGENPWADNAGIAPSELKSTLTSRRPLTTKSNSRRGERGHSLLQFPFFPFAIPPTPSRAVGLFGRNGRTAEAIEA